MLVDTSSLSKHRRCDKVTLKDDPCVIRCTHFRTVRCEPAHLIFSATTRDSQISYIRVDLSHESDFLFDLFSHSIFLATELKDYLTVALRTYCSRNLAKKETTLPLI